MAWDLENLAQIEPFVTRNATALQTTKGDPPVKLNFSVIKAKMMNNDDKEL